MELYNLKNDIGEKQNLAEKMPQKVAELRKLLDQWLEKVDAQLPEDNPDYNPGPRRPARAQARAQGTGRGGERADGGTEEAAGAEEAGRRAEGTAGERTPRRDGAITAEAVRARMPNGINE